jgi:hypothetical protein
LRTQFQTPDSFFGAGFSGHLIKDNLLTVIENLPDGISELICHPGEREQKYSHWNFSWEDELKVLVYRDV